MVEVVVDVDVVVDVEVVVLVLVDVVVVLVLVLVVVVDVVVEVLVLVEVDVEVEVPSFDWMTLTCPLALPVIIFTKLPCLVLRPGSGVVTPINDVKSASSDKVDAATTGPLDALKVTASVSLPEVRAL